MVAMMCHYLLVSSTESNLPSWLHDILVQNIPLESLLSFCFHSYCNSHHLPLYLEVVSMENFPWKPWKIHGKCFSIPLPRFHGIPRKWPPKALFNYNQFSEIAESHYSRVNGHILNTYFARVGVSNNKCLLLNIVVGYWSNKSVRYHAQDVSSGALVSFTWIDFATCHVWI